MRVILFAFSQRFAFRVLVGVVALALIAGCDVVTLGTGGTLSLSFQASKLYPAPLPTGAPGDSAGCLASGGAVVDVRAWGADGRPASATQVTLWLDPSGTAALKALGTVCGVGETCIQLGQDGTGAVCLLPGEEAGPLTVFAHSGVVQTSKSLSVDGHSLPPGSSLSLSISAETTTVVQPLASTMCGASSAPCFPGLGRRAAISIVALPAAGASQIPDGTTIVLDVTAGYLASTGDCGYDGGTNQLKVITVDSAANAHWCFGDNAVAAALRAQSGSTSASANLTVAAVPAAAHLTASAQSVTDSGSVTLTAAVVACDGAPIADIPLVFRTVSGQARFQGPTLNTTSSGGVATTAAELSSTSTFSVAPVIAPGIECRVQVEVLP